MARMMMVRARIRFILANVRRRVRARLGLGGPPALSGSSSPLNTRGPKTKSWSRLNRIARITRPVLICRIWMKVAAVGKEVAGADTPMFPGDVDARQGEKQDRHPRHRQKSLGHSPQQGGPFPGHRHSPAGQRDHHQDEEQHTSYPDYGGEDMYGDGDFIQHSSGHNQGG